jgi:hypothetical protein
MIHENLLLFFYGLYQALWLVASLIGALLGISPDLVMAGLIVSILLEPVWLILKLIFRRR